MIVLNDVLKGKHSVAIGGHIRPDGDCVGSTIGLYLYLTTYYPEIETDLYLEEIPEAFQMMGHRDVPKHEIVEGKVYDLFISLDCGDERRLGFSEPVFQKAKETLCVDHHISNESFADTNYIVPDASSTSELVFRLLDEEKITEEIASFLYMGIVHDTGVFQYSCTSPETMEVGAALLRKGINGSAIIDGTYFEKSYVQNQMLGKALLESMMILNKKAVVSVIRLKEMEFFQAKPSDLDGIVSVEGKVYDLFISLDCGDERRLGFSEPVFQKAKETLCVDHHISNESFADTNYIVPDASSTSELVFRLLDEEKITEEIASFLYMGIVHDTGVFQYSCTSPETMEVGAALLRKGINGSAIIDGTYFEKSYVQNQMLGKALLESMMILNKKAVVSVIRLKEMEFFQAKPSDLDGIVSVLRQTRGVEVAILLYELEPQTFKVSLRSKEIVDVSAVAKYYGGGGHVRAAGVTMKGSPYDVINNLTLLIERQLRAAEEKNEEK